MRHDGWTVKGPAERADKARPGETGHFGSSGGQGVAGSNPVSPTVKCLVRGGFGEIRSRLYGCPRGPYSNAYSNALLGHSFVGIRPSRSRSSKSSRVCVGVNRVGGHSAPGTDVPEWSNAQRPPTNASGVAASAESLIDPQDESSRLSVREEQDLLLVLRAASVATRVRSPMDDLVPGWHARRNLRFRSESSVAGVDLSK